MTAMRRLLTVCAVLGLTCAMVRAADPRPASEPQPGGDTLNLDHYYGDAVSHIGSFPGTLSCVPTKQPFVPENVTPCADNKVYVLTMTKPEAVIPLVGATRRTTDQFQTLLGTQVVVRGKHYPDKNMIAVGSIESAATAGDAPSEPAAEKPPSALGH